MSEQRFEPVMPGEPISASQFNRAMRAVETQSRFNGQGTMTGMTGHHTAPEMPTRFWAKITGGTQPYAWIRETGQVGGTLIDAGEAFLGTTDNYPAYEATGQTDVPADVCVELVLADNGDYYLFSYAGGDGCANGSTGDSFFTGDKSVCEGDGSLHTWTFVNGRLKTAP